MPKSPPAAILPAAFLFLFVRISFCTPPGGVGILHDF